ncbi:MAG: tyrosine--tRNA ligase [Patescibacteria group bacterium]
MFGAFSRKINTDPSEIENLLSRGVEEVFVKDSLYKKLISGKPLRVKLGFDPTGSKIHIGRAIILRKLKVFQDLGHTAVFIVGDFTAAIGDPSDKLEKRPTLGREEIEKNLKDYKTQIGKIINLDKTEFHYNSKWLRKLTFEKAVELAESFSVQQMSARRNFKDRFEKGEEVSLREFLYPLMQGYDSVEVRADVEIGGFDQLFNLKAGRIVQRHYGQKEQDILTTTMLEGTDGRKMSTSLGNVINITDEPEDMFGKVMSVQDSLMEQYFLLATNMPLSEIHSIKESLKESVVNPRDIKLRLARTIVTLYHGAQKAEKAEKHFINVFSKGGVPEDVLEVNVSPNTLLVDILITQNIVSSKSEFARLILEKAITKMHPQGDIKIINGAAPALNGVYKIGKRRFIKVVVR